MANIRLADGARYRRLRRALIAERRECWICKAFERDAEIDYSLPAGNDMAFELDHLVPISRGGSVYDPANCAATHRICNRWRGARSVADVMAAAQGVQGDAPIVVTTDWV